MRNFTVNFIEDQINCLQPDLSSNYCDWFLSVTYPHHYLSFSLVVSSVNFVSSNFRFSSRSAVQCGIHKVKDQSLKDSGKNPTYSGRLRHISCPALRLVDCGFSVKIVINLGVNMSQKSKFANLC